MSGNPNPTPRDKERHFDAARNWLDRAEKQFSSGESVLASATLMLAQAELKLLVESVAVGETVRDTSPARPSGFRLLPLTRTLIGAAALAACMMIGLAIGRITAPILPAGLDNTGGDIRISEVAEPQVQPSAIPGESLIQKLNNGQVAPSAGDSGETLIAEAPPTEPRPSHTTSNRPRTTYTPPPPAPVIIEETETPEPVETIPEPVEIYPPVDTGIPEDNILQPAELALRTIQALTERIHMGDAE